jgi:hypothetical protein
MERHAHENSTQQAAVPPRTELRKRESLSFPTGKALALVDSVPQDGREIIWDQGEGHITLVAIGDVQLVEKRFYSGNTVSDKAGVYFEKNKSRNGDGLNLVAAALDARLAPLGVTVIAPPFDEDEHRMVTPLIQAPDLDFLSSRLFLGYALPASDIRKTIVNDFVTRYPEIDRSHVQTISSLVIKTADDLKFRLKAADFILLDVALGHTGIETTHPDLKLQATLVLMDLH